jgi:hypothetical protein
VLTELKNRGVQDACIAVGDELNRLSSGTDADNGMAASGDEVLPAAMIDPTWAKLVRTLVDIGQRLADVVGQGVFGVRMWLPVLILTVR